jgi:hypothetical protein
MKTELSKAAKDNATHWCTGFQIPIAKHKTSQRFNSDEDPELTRKRRYAEELANNKVDELDEILGYGL